jgi:hypothetical protein
VYQIADGKDGKVYYSHSYVSAFLFVKQLESRDRTDNITCMMKWAEYNKQQYPNGRAIYRKCSQWWVVLLPGGPFQIRCVTSIDLVEEVTNIYNYILDTGIRPTMEQYSLLKQVLVLPFEYNHVINEVQTIDYLFEPPLPPPTTPLPSTSCLISQSP